LGDGGAGYLGDPVTALAGLMQATGGRPVRQRQFPGVGQQVKLLLPNISLPPLFAGWTWTA
jgi:hypothetical protein